MMQRTVMPAQNSLYIVRLKLDHDGNGGGVGNVPSFGAPVPTLVKYSVSNVEEWEEIGDLGLTGRIQHVWRQDATPDAGDVVEVPCQHCGLRA